MPQRLRIELAARGCHIAEEDCDRLPRLSRSCGWLPLGRIRSRTGAHCCPLCEIERRIVGENRTLELLQLTTRLESELIGEESTPRLVRVQGVCLAP